MGRPGADLHGRRHHLHQRLLGQPHDPHDRRTTCSANKTLAIDGLFTPDWVKKWKDKVLAIPGPTWFTGALFQNKDNIGGQPGDVAGHASTWAGEPIGTGNVGGGFDGSTYGEPRMRGYLPAVRDERTQLGQAHHGASG